MFARVLRGLSNSKLAKPGKFRAADGMGYALRCSYKVGLDCAAYSFAGLRIISCLRLGWQ